jgi:hypothetical protein
MPASLFRTKQRIRSSLFRTLLQCTSRT